MSTISKLSKNLQNENFSRKRKRANISLKSREEERFLSNLYHLQIQINENVLKYEKYVKKDHQIRKQMEKEMTDLKSKVSAILHVIGEESVDPFEVKDSTNQSSTPVVPPLARKEMNHKMYTITQKFESKSYEKATSFEDIYSTVDNECQTDKKVVYDQFVQTDKSMEEKLEELSLFQDLCFLQNDILEFRRKNNIN